MPRTIVATLTLAVRSEEKRLDGCRGAGRLAAFLQAGARNFSGGESSAPRFLDWLGSRVVATSVTSARPDQCPHQHCRKSSSRAPSRAFPAASTARCGPGAPSAATRVFIQRARGANLWDADGRMYIDYVGSWGPMILGHAHPKVLTRDPRRACARAPASARRRRARSSWRSRSSAALPSIEMVRLVQLGHRGDDDRDPPGARLHRPRRRSSSSTAATTATPTRCWCAPAPGAATFGVPDSAGVPEAIASQTLVARVQRSGRGRGLLRRRAATHIAAVIVEPVVGNMGVIPPAAGLPRRPARADASATARC